MAGFFSRFKDTNLYHNVSDKLLSLSNLGMQYNDMVIKNKQAIGNIEGQFIGNGGIQDEDFLATLSYADIGQRKYISFYDKEYHQKIEFLRKFAMNEEIEFIVDTICDEAIVFDEKNYFCYPDLANFGANLKDSVRESMSDKAWENFKFIYNRFNFNDDITAWQFFRKFLVDGFLAFEIIYSDDQDKIIGFQELNSISLKPIVKTTTDGKKSFWLQNEDTPFQRELSDAQIIYISYKNTSFVSRVSYVERLIRSFNLLRILENSRIIWNLMNSTYRLKITVPVGEKSKARAQESLAKMMASFKEDVFLDYDSGELLVNGKPGLQFFRNYFLPQKNGESPNIETVAAEGHDLSDTEAMKYFYKKLQVASKIPPSRFDSEGNGGQTMISSADGMDREEVRFSKFINRLRSVFQEILIKPWRLQMVLDYPEMADDELFRASLGVAFNKDNVFEQNKFMELTLKKLDFVNQLAAFTQMDGTTPYFSKEFLITKYLGLNRDDLVANKQQMKKDLSGVEEPPAEGEAGAAGGDTGGFGGEPAPGGETPPADTGGF